MKVAPGNADVSRSGDFRCHRCFDATPRDALRVGQLAQPSRFHLRHFDDFSLGVVGGPLAYLFAVFKIPRPHLGTVFPEPLLKFGHHVIDGKAPGLDGSVLVTVDAFLDRGILANIPGQPWKKCRSPDSGKAMSAFCSRGNEQSPEFLVGRPVKKSSLTEPFYRP
jgi:hypothetical protein